MKGQFLQKVSNKLSATSMKLKKASPELLIVGGAIGMVAAAVGACVATRKIDAIIEKHKEDVQDIHEFAENPDIPEYTEKDAQKDITITYAKTAWRLVKLYAPSIILGAASLGCIFASHSIMRKRNAALAAAYAAVDGAFKKYRKNVVERFGDEVDKQMRFSTKVEEITEEETDENGKKKRVKKKVEVGPSNPLGLSDYARCFDESNPNFKGTNTNNAYWLERMQSYFNDLLTIRARDNEGVFLNEVYRDLGFAPTKAGQTVGWRKDMGDGFIDFGIHTYNRMNTDDFRHGGEPCVWLDFNVAGVITEPMREI